VFVAYFSDLYMQMSGLAGRRVMGHSVVMPKKGSEMPRRRRSASADAALRAEIERVSRMSIEERIKAALSMRERFAWLPPKNPDT
jgi:hypothetical protein